MTSAVESVFEVFSSLGESIGYALVHQRVMMPKRLAPTDTSLASQFVLNQAYSAPRARIVVLGKWRRAINPRR